MVDVAVMPAWVSEASDESAALTFSKSDNNRYQATARLWRETARDKQLPPALNHPIEAERRDDWFIWFIGSGRGFGKTWTGANWVIEKAAENPGCIIALLGQTADDVRKTMIEINPSSIMKQSPPEFMPKYEPSKRQLTWPNGTVAVIYYGDEPEQLRGPQPHFVWIDELAKFKYPQQMWDMLEFGMRSGDQPQVLITTTPRPIPVIKSLITDPDTVYVTGSTYENEANLSARFITRIKKKYEGTRLGRQELKGEILDDAPGALWNREWLDDPYRVTKHPDLVRIVVSIDPAPTSGEDSNQTGLTVEGLGIDKHGYLLHSEALRDLPTVWAKQAVALYHLFKADCIIGEANNGGDMIESLIRAIDPNVNYKKVHASRGKVSRAEPIAALYEQHRVHHVGNHAELEDQYCQWEQGMESPDLLDSAVWGFTDLMLDDEQEAHEEPAPSWLTDYRGI